MSNISVNETLLFSTNSENASVTYWENAVSYSSELLTASSEYQHFQLLVKSAFVCWFIQRKDFFSINYELLLLTISFHFVCRKDLDICGLSFVWTCYMHAVTLVRRVVWLSCLILFLVSVKLSTNAPDFLSHLEFTVDILFIYYMFSEIATRCIIALNLHTPKVLILVYLLTRLCVHRLITPGPNVDELNLTLMMFVDMIVFGLFSEQETCRFMYSFVAFGYCFCKNISLHDVTG